MDAAGGNEIQRTSAPGAEEQPSWSPDGTQIAFQRTSGTDAPEIYTMVIGATGVGTSITNRTNSATTITDTNASWQPADTAAPDTTITGGPAGGSSTNDNTPTFSFTSTEPGSTFQCSVNGAAFSSCSSPFTTTALVDGSRSFAVQATDPNGNVDATAASRTFTIDTVVPNTTIASGPSGATNDDTPTFAFTSTEGGSTFQCRVDAAAFTSCASPFTTASQIPGAHTFEVRATDAANNTDATAASRSFTVVTNSTVTKDGAAVTYESVSGETNDLAITGGGGSPLVFTESAATRRRPELGPDARRSPPSR